MVGLDPDTEALSIAPDFVGTWMRMFHWTRVYTVEFSALSDQLEGKSVLVVCVTHEGDIVWREVHPNLENRFALLVGAEPIGVLVYLVTKQKQKDEDGFALPNLAHLENLTQVPAYRVMDLSGDIQQVAQKLKDGGIPLY